MPIKMVLWLAIVSVRTTRAASVMPRVIGGTVVSSSDKYPFAVSLLHDWNHICGGSILTEDTILTAAHCVRKNVAKPRDIQVYIGHANIKDRITDADSTYTVKSIRVHPGFVPNKLSERGNDIAVLKLRRNMSLNGKNVAQVCLPRPADKPGACTIIGWGKTNISEWTGNVKLMEAPLPIIPDSECQSVYNYTRRSLICAGGSLSGGPTSSCFGDSGGPYLCEVDGRMLQFGLVSFGKSQKCNDAPVFFTKVAAFLDWIQNGD